MISDKDIYQTQGSCTLAIEIWDRDGDYWKGKDDLVLIDHGNIVLEASRNEETSTAKSMTLKNGYSTLDVEVRQAVKCSSCWNIDSHKRSFQLINQSINQSIN